MFRRVNDFMLYVRLGDTGVKGTFLSDWEIHPQFDTQNQMEAFANALNPLLEGKIRTIRSNIGEFTDMAMLPPNDTGVAVTKTYTIKFNDVPMTCKFEVGFVNPLKIKEVGQVLKTLEFYNGATKLVIKSVKVSM